MRGRFLEAHARQAQGGSNGYAVLEHGAKRDLGFRQPALSLDGPVHRHIAFCSRGIQGVVVGQQQPGAPSEGSTVAKNLTRIQRVVGAGVSVHGRVVQGLRHKQVGHRVACADPVDLHLLGEGSAVLVSHGEGEERPIGIYAGVGQGDSVVAGHDIGLRGLHLPGAPKRIGRAGVHARRHGEVATSVHAQSCGVDAHAAQVSPEGTKGATHGRHPGRSQGVDPAVAKDVGFVLGQERRGEGEQPRRKSP